MFVTGAAGGIGQALVSEFVSANYNVIASDYNWQESQFRNERIFELKLDLEQMLTDPSLLECLKQCVDKITNGIGIQALVNNAAVQILNTAQFLTMEQWKSTWDVNLTAPFVLIQTFFEHFASNQGAVVNISSIHATQTKKKFVAYATSKAALSSMTRNLAVDVGDKFRINAIEPAAVATEMLKAGFENNPNGLKELGGNHPAGRIAMPKEIAELAVFLCSDKAQFIHGACLRIDGGISNRLHDPD